MSLIASSGNSSPRCWDNVAQSGWSGQHRGSGSPGPTCGRNGERRFASEGGGRSGARVLGYHVEIDELRRSLEDVGHDLPGVREPLLSHRILLTEAGLLLALERHDHVE